MIENSHPALQAKAITRIYPGVTALNGVDMTLYPGHVTALVGENGAGKSTLIRIIGGLESPTTASSYGTPCHAVCDRLLGAQTAWQPTEGNNHD